MNKVKQPYHLRISCIAAVLSTIFFSASPTFAESASTIQLDVSAFKNNRGTLICRLFNKAANFPDGVGILTENVAIPGPTGSCTFSDIKSGSYAVAVIHDENGNGQLDKNFVGMPTEGYGVSNNKTYALSSPKWEESTFSVGTAESKVLQVKLRY